MTRSFRFLAVALVVVVAGIFGLGMLLSVAPSAADLLPFLSGNRPAQQAVSRFHVRWYAVAMIFLAFDMEMIFMYPWSVVVASVGTSAVAEMFAFLSVLFAGVWYAWREGALRWA